MLSSYKIICYGTTPELEKPGGWWEKFLGFKVF